MKEKEERYMFNEFKKTFAQACGVVAGYVVAGAVVVFVYPYIKGFIDIDEQEKKTENKTN